MVEEIELPPIKRMLSFSGRRFPTAKDFTRNPEIEGYLMNLYRRLIIKERSGVHASDLDFPRKALFDKLYPSPPSNSEILRWVRGQSLHAFFETIFKDYPNAEVEEETVYIRDGTKIYTKPDVLLRFTGIEPNILVPIMMEFKTTMYELKGNPLPYEHWCQRLLNYMALYGTEMGVLTVQILDKDELKCFISPRITEELIELRRQMIFYRVKEFEEMLKKKVNYFDLCPAWLCHKGCTHIPRCYRSLKELKERG